jgi:hypothetical protein
MEKKSLDKLDKFMRSKEDGYFCIGHSSALIRLDGDLILLDPVWGDYKPYSSYWTFFPKQYICDKILPKVKACFVSHAHGDHLCPEILAKLKCPITVMRGRRNLVHALNRHSDVVERLPYVWYQLTEKTSIYITPHPYNTVDSACFISNGTHTIFFGNDCFLDKNVLDRVAKDIGPGRTDIALVYYAFIHFYPMLLENLTMQEKEIEIERLNKQSIAQADMLVNYLRPTVTVPIGNSLYYAADKNHELNRYLAKPSDVYGAVEMEAGDSIILRDGTCDILRTPHFQEFERTYFLPMDFSAIAQPEDLNNVIRKMDKAVNKVENHEIIINNVVVDTETHEISLRHRYGDKPYTRFQVNDVEFKKWLKGEMTFEQVLGTRRFKYSREPNVYNLAVMEFFSLYL